MSGLPYTVPVSSHLHASYSHPVLRAWSCGSASPLPSTATFVWPLFLVSGPSGVREPIASMPGQYRWSVDRLPEALEKPVAEGLRAVLLFGVQPDASMKDAHGSGADMSDSVVCAAIRLLRKLYPDLLIMCDVCLCGYTSHGHCGVLTRGTSESDAGGWLIDNDASIARISSMAIAFARAGAHVIAPSDMMDGRVGAIKAALRTESLLSQVAVMSYAAKFASCMYGPFRDAAVSGMAFGDRQGYQLPAGSRSLA
jgi:porphobilinogen synthase